MSYPGRASPVPSAHVPTTGTRRYGDARPSHVHAGVDLGGRDGTAVLAPEAGTVLTVAEHGRRGFRGYAPAVLLAGDSGRFHLLAHLSGGLVVREGERVQLGAQLGAFGAPEHHTHWEVRTTAGPLSGSSARVETRTIDHTLAPAEWLEGLDVTFGGEIPAPISNLAPRELPNPPNFFFSSPEPSAAASGPAFALLLLAIAMAGARK